MSRTRIFVKRSAGGETQLVPVRAIGQSGPVNGWALFDTAIGQCGLAWGPGGLIGVQLPEASEVAMRARLVRRFPSARERTPTAGIEEAIASIRCLLRGEPGREVALDLSKVTDFDRRVYEATCRIPAGRTTTYGEMARSLGDVQLSRAVGQSLGRNPWPVLVPCHRIVSAGGGKGGFTAFGGTATKMRLLRIEGAFAIESLPLFGSLDRETS